MTPIKRWKITIDKLYRDMCISIKVPGGEKRRWWEIGLSKDPFTHFKFKFPNYQLFKIEFILMMKFQDCPLERRNYPWRDLVGVSNVNEEWPPKLRKRAEKEITYNAIKLARRAGQSQKYLHAILNKTRTQVAVVPTSIYLEVLLKRKRYLLFTE